MQRDIVLYGDALSMLRTLPDNTFQTCCTSPPYFGLRDYETRYWMGGSETCEHDKAKDNRCPKCSAWWGQLGLEPDPGSYVDHLVEIFNEVRRVLREDGTLWLNIDDSFANDEKWGGATGGKHAKQLHGNTGVGRYRRHTGMKPKDLMGIPWRTALALQDHGWWIRCDNIWAPPNAMPEPVQDRPTRAHEYVFLFSKAKTYFYDSKAIEEEGVSGPRHRRSVWAINTEPYRGAHFAIMPTALASLCIRAGSRPGDLVLDPFAGSGTTLKMAKAHDRDFIGIEVNEEYKTLIEERVGPEIDAASARRVARAADELI